VPDLGDVDLAPLLLANNGELDSVGVPVRVDLGYDPQRARLISPPIQLPEAMLDALQLVVVQYRQRRTGIRRVYEIAEVIPREEGVTMNMVYKWDARSDKLQKVGGFKRVLNDLSMHTGMTPREISKDLNEKQAILKAMCESKIDNVDAVGKIVGWYYRKPGDVLQRAKKKTLKALL